MERATIFDRALQRTDYGCGMCTSKKLAITVLMPERPTGYALILVCPVCDDRTESRPFFRKRGH